MLSPLPFFTCSGVAVETGIEEPGERVRAASSC